MLLQLQLYLVWYDEWLLVANFDEYCSVTESVLVKSLTSDMISVSFFFPGRLRKKVKLH